MKRMIAFCGIVCSDCHTFIATQEDNDEKRIEIAKVWSTPEYTLKPEDINCDGCLTKPGKFLTYAKDICEIRKCGIQRKAKNCAYCPEYPCEKLTKFHEAAPKAKASLEEIRKKPDK